jgi:hypothetical protein
MPDKQTIQSPLDFLASGPGKRLAAAGYDPKVLRTNGLLRKEEWVRYDEAVVRVARQRLGIIMRLRAKGLIYDAGNLGTLTVEWERLSDMTEAHQSMGLETRGQRDRATWDLQQIPIPITSKEFEVNIRHLTASRNRGSSLDVTNAELAGAVVSESLEGMIVNGSTVKIGGNQAYGLNNFPDRLTGTLTADWDVTTTTGEQILKDVLAMIKALQAKNYYGPYELFIGTSYNNKLAEDFKANSDKSIRARLLEIDELDAINTSAKIAAGAVHMIQMTSNVIDIAVAQDILTVEWAEMGGLLQEFLVFAAMAPRLKSDRAGQSGIAHYSKP